MIRFIVFWMIALVLIYSGPAESQHPTSAYLGLYDDANRSSWCVDFSPPIGMAAMWIWMLPSTEGTIGVEFAIQFPSNVINVGSYANNRLSCMLTPEACDGEHSWVFQECQTDWAWIVHWDVMILDLNSSQADIIPPPDSPYGLISWSCAPGYPIRPCIILNSFYYNGCAPLSAETTTWGAMKALYR
jgi:hypothetical protein